MDTKPPALHELEALMPDCAPIVATLRRLVGKPMASQMLQAGIDLAEAFGRDDFAGVSAVYKRAKAAGFAPPYIAQGQYAIGVPEAAMRAFAARHRAAKEAAKTVPIDKPAKPTLELTA